MKQAYTLLAAFLILAATALWSGCSNNELTDIDSTSGEGSSQTVETFSFSIKKAGAQTRAVGDDLLKPEESVIKTMYVALFLRDSGNEPNSKLHRIYCLDDAADEAFKELKITVSGGVYNINKPGTVGDYVVYFIANPDNEIKKSLLAMHKSTGDARATLSTLESSLQTGDNTADGKTDGDGTLQTNEAQQRGFIMMGKENITLSQSTSMSVTLNRLAARFDFINSAATAADNKVTITQVEIHKAAQSSVVAALASTTETTRLTTLTPSLTAWTDQVAANYFTTYAYENLATTGTEVTSIAVYYTLDGQKKSLTIKLEKDGVALGVTRNHLYRIYLNGVSGEYKLVVADWNEGETVKVPNEDLAIEYKATDLGKIGDIALITPDGKLSFVDGGLRKMTLDGSLTWDLASRAPISAENQKRCVGIVFTNKVSDTDYRAGYKKGYVMALKDAAVNTQWKTENTLTGIPNMVRTDADVVKDMDGLAHCKYIADNSLLGTHPAFKVAMEYVSSSALPAAGTSGWYLPSSGQWCEFLKNLAGVSFTRLENSTSNFERNICELAPYAQNSISPRLNERLNVVGEGNYVAFFTTISSQGQWFRTSSEISGTSSSYAVVVDFYPSSGNLSFRMHGDAKKTLQNNDGYVRPVFAF